MKFVSVIAASAALGACSEGLTNPQRDEVGEIAGEVAYDVVSEHEKIKELESRIDELERQVR